MHELGFVSKGVFTFPDLFLSMILCELAVTTGFFQFFLKKDVYIRSGPETLSLNRRRQSLAQNRAV